MQSESTQKVLLTIANHTLEKALEISQGMEAATIKSNELKGSQPSSSVLAVGTPTVQNKLCGRCGRGNHDKSMCKFRNATCHKCGKIGYIAPACRSKAAGKPIRGPTRKTKWLSTTTTITTTEPAPLPEKPTTQPDDSAESADESVEEFLFVVNDTSLIFPTVPCGAESE